MMRDEMPGFVRKKRALGITESLNPAQILVGGFLILIVLASFLLMLPISSNS